jgi:hypothetical protein
VQLLNVFLDHDAFEEANDWERVIGVDDIGVCELVKRVRLSQQREDSLLTLVKVASVGDESLGRVGNSSMAVTRCDRDAIRSALLGQLKETLNGAAKGRYV